MLLDLHAVLAAVGALDAAPDYAVVRAAVVVRAAEGRSRMMRRVLFLVLWHFLHREPQKGSGLFD